MFAKLLHYHRTCHTFCHHPKNHNINLKRENLYRTDWQTVIKMRVISFILALSLVRK